MPTPSLPFSTQTHRQTRGREHLDDVDELLPAGLGPELLLVEQLHLVELLSASVEVNLVEGDPSGLLDELESDPSNDEDWDC